MSSGWNAIWDGRAAPEATGSVLRRMMNAGGLDSGFAPVSEAAWLDYVRRMVKDLQLQPGESVFEVGCGAGAFLYELDRMGCHVAGLDRSATSVALAREVLPRGRFTVDDAANLDPDEPSDVVVSMGVFLYFESEDYSLEVLERMAKKARRAVAVLDLPDRAWRDAAIAERQRLAGGPAAYARRYAGLDHQYFDRGRTADAMHSLGLTQVHVANQELVGYHNAPFRFNVWGFRNLHT